jgi:hypothetical protein
MYSLYISLTAKGAVTMLADISPETGSVPKTAKFSLRSEKTNAIIAFSEGTYLDSIFVKRGAILLLPTPVIPLVTKREIRLC